MECAEFLNRFSDYCDDSLERPEAERFDAHLRTCRSCRRYTDVVRRGVDLLRSLPTVDVPADFHPRLQHRIYHVDDAQALAGESGSGSGVTAVTALAMAALLTLAAWSPALRDGNPTVELPPIVVEDPPMRAFPGLRPAPILLTAGSYGLADGTLERIWNPTHALLYASSPFLERNRNRSAFRSAGFGQD